VIQTVVDSAFCLLCRFMLSVSLIAFTENYLCIPWPDRIQGSGFRKAFADNGVTKVAVVLPPSGGLDILIGFRSCSSEWARIERIIHDLEDDITTSNWATTSNCSSDGFIAGVAQGESDDEYLIILPIKPSSSSRMIRQ